MFNRILLSLVVLALSAAADDRLIQLNSAVLKISPANEISVVLSPGAYSEDISNGSTAPLLSPDTQWIALTGKDNNIYLKSTTQSRPKLQVNHDGRPQTLKYASAETFIVGFTPDSKALLYTVVAGETECIDCDRPDYIARKSGYGRYLYSLHTHTSKKLPFPESIWPLHFIDGTHLLAEKSGSSDQLLEMDLITGTAKDLPMPYKNFGQCAPSPDRARMLCVSGDSKTSQVTEHDLRSGTARTVSAPASFAGIEWPSYSPSAKHTAWVLRVGSVRSQPVTSLAIDGHLLARKWQGVLNYAWIDDDRIAVLDSGMVEVLNLEGKMLATKPLPQAQ